MTEPTSEWLQEQLSQLLAQPHIHFTQPKVAGLQLRMGPGPIDLFSTRFNNIFSKEATGVVGGQEVDRNGLKEGLLKLQKKWNKDDVQFASHEPDSNHQVASKFVWTPKESDSKKEVAASASVVHEGGTQRIKSLNLDGDSELFA